MTKRDYYEILGVSKDSSSEQIKKAYRQLALKYHPDRVEPEKRKQAEEQFKEISEAYAVLSDENKRAQYDRFGHAGIDGRYTYEDLFRSADFGSIFEDLGFGGSIFDDIFSSFGFFGQKTSRRGPSRGADLQYELEITLEEAASGIEKAITVKRREQCPTCNGEGAKPGTKKVTCPDCKGAGQVGTSAGFFTITHTCERCQGKGVIIQNPCKSCQGTGQMLAERKINVKIPPGVDTGSHLRMRGEGEAGTKGGPRGELYIVIQIKPHPIFERRDNDVYCRIPVSFVQAALGGELQVPTLHDGKVSLKIPSGTQSGKVFRLNGKGFSDLRGYGKGDQYVQVNVEVPINITAQQRKLLQEFEKLSQEETKSESIADKIKKAFKQ